MRLTLSALLGLLLVASCAPDRSAAAPAAAGAAPALGFPLACVIGRDCEVQHYVDADPGPGVRDYHGGRRTYEGHNGVDIRLLDMAAQKRGVEVRAAAAGKAVRLRDGVADVSIRATGAGDVSGQECGNGVVIDHGGGWETQYCHLARGSVKAAQGQAVAAGQTIGLVGLSGQTEFPHLHVTVRHNRTVVDPFAPAPGAAPLWTPQALQAMRYKPGAVLNMGFASAAVTMDAVESGTLAPPTAASPGLVAYARAIELEVGDILELRLKGPDGAILAQSSTPLDRDKAQYLVFVGRKRPPTGWAAGTYRAEYTVSRQGKAVLTRSADLRL